MLNESDAILEAFNCSILIDCTAYIERFINLYLMEYLNEHYSQLDSENIYRYFIKEINNSQFHDSLETYNTLTGKTHAMETNIQLVVDFLNFE